MNDLSVAALAPLPIIPAYSISKAAAFNVTQSLRMLLASEGVTVHAVVLGPIDTDMNRRLEIPKASAESAAARISMGWHEAKRSIFPIRPRRRWPGLARERCGGARTPVRGLRAGDENQGLTRLRSRSIDLLKKSSTPSTTSVPGGPETSRAVTEQVGAEFEYPYKDVHDTTQRVTEWMPGKRVVWHIVDSHIDFVEDRTEWNGTDIVFEIRKEPGQDRSAIYARRPGSCLRVL